MTTAAEHASQVAAVEQALRTLPERYLGCAPGAAASYRIRLGDLGRSGRSASTSTPRA